MKEQDREEVTREMIRGFNDCAAEAGTLITGGQSILNPWPIIGGVANVMCHKDEFIKPNSAKAGDVLVLTKPLGTQPAVNLRQKLSAEGGTDFFKGKPITEEEINNAYFLAMESMGTLNKNCASLMKRFEAKGATDITGFGILGHTQNLAAAQVEEVDLVLKSLPIIDKCDLLIEGMPDFQVTKGFSAETSGGLLVMLEPSRADDFMKAAKEDFGQDTWLVGEIV